MAAAVRVVFNGVRGSTPCSGAEYDRFGGSSSCVAIETEDSAPVILDLGTGLRRYGARWDAPGAEPFRGHVLLTHLHWDHVQGLPFFTPLHRPGAVLEVFGPRLESGSLAESLDRLMAPPFFPIRAGDLDDRALWDDFQAAYQDAIRRTSTEHAPWYVVPADRNWVRNAAISRIVRETLEEMDPKYPEPKGWDPKTVKVV